MDLKNMMLLIEAVDTLERLDEAIMCFTPGGYSDNFDELNNIVTVIKEYSIYKECHKDDETDEFYDYLRDDSISVEERAKVLLGLQE